MVHMNIFYTATATAAGDGRNGHVRTSDGLLDTDVCTPPEMGGPGGATNPEQLFAAGYAACFHSALRLVAREQKADVSDSSVTAHVSIGSNGDGGFGLAAKLAVSLPAVDPDVAQKLVRRAHEVCPYSNATRGNIDVVLDVA
jgi:Ohr subfamily peroxiredoxin